MQKWRKRLKWFLFFYGLVGIVIYYVQDYLFFQSLAVKQSHRYNFSIPYREINLPYTVNQNFNIIQFTTAQPPKGVVLYFHGNRKNIGWYAKFAPMFTAKGYEVWMPDYPGYAKSTWKLTVQVLYEHILQLYKLSRKRFSPDSIIIFGKSMGTGLATYLGSRVESRRVILETPYYSLSSVASHFFPIYPMEWMTRVKIPSWEYLQQVDEPVTIFHGTEDGVIPYSNASRLKQYLKNGDEFITIPGGSHNDLRNFPLFTKKLDSILVIGH